MKKILFLSTFLCAALSLSVWAAKPKAPAELNVMSYNIRLGTADDGTNSWKYRFPATYDMLVDQHPDIFGVQEAYDFQIEFILQNLPQYKALGVGREDGKHEGEHMSVFYNKKKIQVLKWGTYWLSETPEVPSKGWDAMCYRTATWVLAKDKASGKKFYFVNTHLDHRGKTARKEGLALIVKRIAQMNPEGYPMVLTGDFNVRPDDPCLEDLDKIMASARVDAEKSDDTPSYNGWGKKTSVIDYIYHSGFSKCTEFKVVTKPYSGFTYVSDHYPIRATLVF